MLKTMMAQFSSRAIATDFAVGGGLAFVGDIICQINIECRTLDPTRMRWRRRGEPPVDESSFDPRRLAATTVFMATYIGTAVHFSFQAYPFAVFSFARQLPAASQLRSRLLRQDTTAHAFGCACIDNIAQGALFFAPFFYGVGLLQGDSLSDCRANLAAEWLPSYVVSIPYWLPIITGNFALVAQVGALSLSLSPRRQLTRPISPPPCRFACVGCLMRSAIELR